MQVRPELDPDVDDEAPTLDLITPYDEQHHVTYMRLLDAEADGADWTEVARIVPHRDPVTDAALLGKPPCPCSLDDENRLPADTGTGR